MEGLSREESSGEHLSYLLQHVTLLLQLRKTY